MISIFGKYLRSYGEGLANPLHIGEAAAIDQIVVIPALAEKETLFFTLASLAANPREDLQRTLALCVINNRPAPAATPEEVDNNQETLGILRHIIAGRLPEGWGADRHLLATVKKIIASPLRLAGLDAASAGWELPERGGVGHARKLGMDRALGLCDASRGGARLLICLDADTRVAANYLPAIRRHFTVHPSPAAVIAYAHPLPDEPALRAAIVEYELFLRYYVLGLSWAASPYAFHTIGSTMACTAAAYAAVRGMPRRQAGEDFYFLNKLAKLGPVGKITATTVYPAARASRRVPFGTGRRIVTRLEGPEEEYLVYDPEVFALLKAWLRDVVDRPDRSGAELAAGAASLHPRFRSFLAEQGFPDAWERIRRNSSSENYLRRQFHIWFDGFRTLKLIRFLTGEDFPPVPVLKAVRQLMEKMGIPGPNWGQRTGGSLSEQEVMTLRYLRELRI